MVYLSIDHAVLATSLVLLCCMSAAKQYDWTWRQGRATYYGTDDWSIHKGSCNYGYLYENEPLGWNVAAMADVSSFYAPGACGLCYEVACDPRVITDNYGEVLDRRSACRNASTSLVVRITDTCPCTYAQNAYSNKRWCCGDVDHLDMSIWAWERLAETRWGVIPLRYREVPCTYTPGSMAPKISNPTPGIAPPAGTAQVSSVPQQAAATPSTSSGSSIPNPVSSSTPSLSAATFPSFTPISFSSSGLLDFSSITFPSFTRKRNLLQSSAGNPSSGSGSSSTSNKALQTAVDLVSNVCFYLQKLLSDAGATQDQLVCAVSSTPSASTPSSALPAASTPAAPTSTTPTTSPPPSASTTPASAPASVAAPTPSTSTPTPSTSSPAPSPTTSTPSPTPSASSPPPTTSTPASSPSPSPSSTSSSSQPSSSPAYVPAAPGLPTRDWPDYEPGHPDDLMVFSGGFQNGWWLSSWSTWIPSSDQIQTPGMNSGKKPLCGKISANGALALKGPANQFVNRLSLNFWMYVGVAGIDGKDAQVADINLSLSGSNGGCSPQRIYAVSPTLYKPTCTYCTDYWWRWVFYLPGFDTGGNPATVINNPQQFTGCKDNMPYNLDTIEFRNDGKNDKYICLDNVLLH